MKILLFLLNVPLIFAMSDPDFIPADPPKVETSTLFDERKEDPKIKVKPQAQEERKKAAPKVPKTKE